MQLVNVWKESNRVSQLWEDLLANYVSPDPEAGMTISIGIQPEPGLPFEAAEMEAGLSPTWQEEGTTPGLLERAGFESLRLFRNALEILTAPPEQELEAYPGQVNSEPGLAYLKVSREPEPQPGSAIDTRRMAYGLKIPTKPLHKRPVYQRFFFYLRQWTRRGSNELSLH